MRKIPAKAIDKVNSFPTDRQEQIGEWIIDAVERDLSDTRLTPEQQEEVRRQFANLKPPASEKETEAFFNKFALFAYFIVGPRYCILRAVRLFDDFTEDNDSYGEHDCAIVSCEDYRALFKIDCDNPTLQHHSEDPADPNKKVRVMTVMFPEKY